MMTESTRKDGVRNTRLRRIAVLALYKSIGRWCPRSSRVTFFPGKFCVKSGHAVNLAEARTLEFIRKNTRIPVPKVLCAFEYRGLVYIAMERLPGQPLSRGWLQRRDVSKAHILQQVRGYIDELRMVPRAQGQNLIAGVDGGPFFDQRLPGATMQIGPFASVKDFHTYLETGQGSRFEHEDVQRLQALHESISEAVCLTHNDLSSFNILADGEQVTGIIDWESAAWLPSYWEYTSAWHVNPQNTYWQSEVVKYLTAFDRELEMEKLRRQYFGDY